MLHAFDNPVRHREIHRGRVYLFYFRVRRLCGRKVVHGTLYSVSTARQMFLADFARLAFGVAEFYLVRRGRKAPASEVMT